MKPKQSLSIVLATSLVLFSACASAIKKKCESTNWFEHGESVAKRGARPSTDSFVLECEKEEANVDSAAISRGFQKGMTEYCTPDYAFRLGKQGEFLSADFCGGGMEIQMKPKHHLGLLEYCQVSNGETAGATGKKYNQICPKELEAAFVPQFNLGRKKYLNGLIARKVGEVSDLEIEASELERKKQGITQNVNRLQWERVKLQQRAPSEQKLEDPTQKQLSAIEQDIRSAGWESHSLDSKMDSLRNKQKELRQEMREAQGELPTL